MKLVISSDILPSIEIKTFCNYCGINRPNNFYYDNDSSYLLFASYFLTFIKNDDLFY